MSDTKTLATILIFVVCGLYVLALLIIAIRFVMQYVKFASGHSDGIRWRQSSGETPRNSFLNELRVNAVSRDPRSRVVVEPPPSYSYVIEEQPPTYEEFEKFYSKTVTPAAAANSNSSVSTEVMKSHKLEECPPPSFSLSAHQFGGISGDSASSNTNMNMNTVDSSLHL